ncbi:uncharacterized protein LOC129704108 [Leucoraja erinacea]|uniref:uncharacterized protein LOC129704108 n=1 Tax=Leucoraja erinaceus TaxID=7782 RepID=UPI002455B38D|nr:uncharacterized protein LOC129704108 [Leucoraja erinacea]
MYPAPMPYGPVTPWRVTVPAETFMLPPIQMHNFSSRPLTLVMVDPTLDHEGPGKHTEYHHFYRTPYISPYWYPPLPPVLPPANPTSYQYPSYYPYTRYVPPAAGAWPEGASLRGDLHWGKMGQIYGPSRELPELLQNDLRRVYGTYPKTYVTISYQNGEYLVKAEPKVGEQKYKVEKKVIRRPLTPSDDEIEVVVEKPKRKSRR